MNSLLRAGVARREEGEAIVTAAVERLVEIIDELDVGAPAARGSGR